MPACWPVFHFPTVIHKYTVFPLVQWLLSLYPCFSTLFFIIQNGYWAVFTPSISRSNLEFYPCPPGYCACTQSSDVGNTICVYTYTNSDPGRQCACDREGIVMWMCSHLSVQILKCLDASPWSVSSLLSCTDEASFLAALDVGRQMRQSSFAFILFPSQHPLFWEVLSLTD